MTQQDLVLRVLDRESDPLSIRRSTYEKSLVDEDGEAIGRQVTDTSPVALAMIEAAHKLAA
jgi:hypothetical protein